MNSLASGSVDERGTLSHGYAGNVRRFLERASRVMKPPCPIGGPCLETIRAYTGDVLTEVARNFFKLQENSFTNFLYYDLVESLAEQMVLDGPSVLQCIPDPSIPHFILVLDELAVRARKDPNSWSFYQAYIDRVKRQLRKPGEVGGSTGQTA